MQQDRTARRRRAACAGLAASLLLAAPAPAAETDPVWPKLTPKLQDLLQREMFAILEASRDILGALVMADHATVAERALAIERSIIMERAMTERDRQDLLAVLPREFVELDKRFHLTAAELAAAAQGNDGARSHALFDRMIETCIACHARFATDRFPGFAGE